MLKFALKRILLLIPTMAAIVTICFFIARLAPGNPFLTDRPLPPETLANLEKKYGLDKPIAIQYFNYLKGLLQGDLGVSYVYTDRSISQIIGDALPVSLLLGFCALVLALMFGSLFGIISALKRHTWVDSLFSSISIFGISLPVFVLGPLVMLVFAMRFRLLPTSGWITENPLALIMPAFTLSFPYCATIARLMRSSMIDVLRSDYIRTAQAKGLSKSSVIFRHALKGAFLPIVSYLGPALANIVSGSIVIEQIFRIPGLGRPFIQSSLNRDYMLIMGCVIVYSFILILVNTLADIIYAWLDPRVSYN